MSATDSQQLSLEAEDEMFLDVERLSLPSLLKRYGGVRIAEGTTKAMIDDTEDALDEDVIDDELVSDDESLEDADEGMTETDEEEMLEDDDLAYVESTSITDGYDLMEAMLSSDLNGQVEKIRTFSEFGLGFLGSGVVPHVDGVCYQLAIRMAKSGALVDQAIVEQGGALDPEQAFEGDLKMFLQGEDVPGLVDVVSLSDAGDAAMTCGVAFRFDDGSDFRVYILGTSSEEYDTGSLIDDLVGSADIDSPEIKADQNCLKKIWGEYYKYFSGKYISAAMQASATGNFPKAAAAMEKARDGFEPKANPNEYNCLEAWRAEFEGKAGATKSVVRKHQPGKHDQKTHAGNAMAAVDDVQEALDDGESNAQAWYQSKMNMRKALMQLNEFAGNTDLTDSVNASVKATRKLINDATAKFDDWHTKAINEGFTPSQEDVVSVNDSIDEIWSNLSEFEELGGDDNVSPYEKSKVGEE